MLKELKNMSWSKNDSNGDRLVTRAILKKRDFKQRNQSQSSNQESIYVQKGGPFSKGILLKERNREMLTCALGAQV